MPLAKALAEDFDVTFAFRHVPDGLSAELPSLNILTAEQLESGSDFRAGNYTNKKNPLGTAGYLTALHRFAAKHARQFDMVIERQWALAGAMAHWFRRRGTAAAAYMEGEFYADHVHSGRRDPIFRSLLNVAQNKALFSMRRSWLRDLNFIATETDQTRHMLIDTGCIGADMRTIPAPMGVDETIFRPRDCAAMRAELGLSQEQFLFVYVGSMQNFIQKPAPFIEALGRSHRDDVALHIIGEGTERESLQQLANACGAQVVFHGRQPQLQAAKFMNAADMCIAPYNKDKYPDGKFTSASLKVVEYLASGRPVLTIPCDRMYHLLLDGRYGFYVENEVDAITGFLKQLPDRDIVGSLHHIIAQDLKSGFMRESDIVLSWHDIAARFATAIRQSLDQSQEQRQGYPAKAGENRSRRRYG